MVLAMDCEKKSFSTEKSALKFIRQGARNLKNKAGRIRSYYCDNCKNFHLTKTSKNKKKKEKKSRISKFCLLTENNT